MKNKFNINVLWFCVVLSSCGNFTNPFDDYFLDWNMNCLERKNKKLIESGYLYKGTIEKAKIIADNCNYKYRNDKMLITQCLLDNGFEKVNSDNKR